MAGVQPELTCGQRKGEEKEDRPTKNGGETTRGRKGQRKEKEPEKAAGERSDELRREARPSCRRWG